MTPFARFTLSLIVSVSLLFIASSARAATPQGGQPQTAAPAVGPEPEGGVVRAATLREQGNQSMLEMRYVDALASYRQALAVDPSNVGVLYSIARAHQLLGEFPEALTVLEQFDQRAAPEVKSKVGRLDELFADLRARVGTLQMTCNVQGARVLIRDKVIGTTPLVAVRLPTGAATLEVELDGFFRERREIVVPSGGVLSLDVTLQARAHSGLLLVRTDPGGARISVDGRAEGTSSPVLELVLPEGAHRVSATRDGYDEASVPLVLGAGATHRLEMPLDKSVPITSRWWFWTGAAVVVAGGVVLTAALLSERPADKGSLTPGQISAPLRF